MGNGQQEKNREREKDKMVSSVRKTYNSMTVNRFLTSTTSFMVLCLSSSCCFVSSVLSCFISLSLTETSLNFCFNSSHSVFNAECSIRSSSERFFCRHKTLKARRAVGSQQTNDQQQKRD